MPVIDQSHIDDALGRMGRKKFSTAEFVEMFRQRYPGDWAILVERYGKGGRGNGSPYSPYNYLGKSLERRAKAGEIAFVEWDHNPPANWGNRIMAVWKS